MALSGSPTSEEALPVNNQFTSTCIFLASIPISALPYVVTNMPEFRQSIYFSKGEKNQKMEKIGLFN
jgi:hypothetical protein